jgi:transcriptional regulator with XRE-family HTH domain
MQLVKTLDPSQTALNNKEAMAKRAGKRVKQWRKERSLNQIAFAKLAGISVGSLQGFETGLRDTRRTNLTKIAAVLGLTADELSDETAPDTPDPRAKDLKDPDYVVANLYHHADADVKYAIKALLRPDLPELTREQVARILLRLLQVTPDDLSNIEIFVRDLDPAPESDPHKKRSSS